MVDQETTKTVLAFQEAFLREGDNETQAQGDGQDHDTAAVNVVLGDVHADKLTRLIANDRTGCAARTTASAGVERP